MKVYFVSSEMTPYASTGGLADVARSLPDALEKDGVQVIRVMPYYRKVAEMEGVNIEDTGMRFEVPVGMNRHQVEVYCESSNGSSTYFIRHDEFFDRSNLYGLSFRDYEDNFHRFVYFQKAAVELLDRLHWHADIVHCNDWQTALVPFFLKYGVHGMGRENIEKTVLTIHNLAYQGIFHGNNFSETHLPFDCYSLEMLEFYGKVNCLKGGIVLADAVTTVSNSYAHEICGKRLGCGLEGVLLDYTAKLNGILNGVDYSIWDPSIDPHIAANFNADDISGKMACRSQLLEQFGLEGQPDVPVIGMVSRLAEQKGFDILSEAIERLMQLPLQLVILGTGQQQYHELCASWAQRWPDKVSVKLDYNNALAHQIEAGSDMFMMPSRFEPCGLNQMYSLRYGTLPIVHATGGLRDTIIDISSDHEQGTGFAFDDYRSGELVTTVERALECFADRGAWDWHTQKAMRLDFSWHASAMKYYDLYQSLLSDKGDV